MFEYFVEQKEYIKKKKVYVHIRDLPATEEDPVELFLRLDKDGIKKEELIFKDTTGEAVERVVLEIPEPKIARTLLIDIRLCIPDRGINSIQNFNVTDNGEHILFAATEQGLKILQKKDDKFEGAVPASEQPQVQVTQQEQQSSSNSVNASSSKQYTLDDLIRLNELVQKGILSQEEFNNIKKRILES